MSTGTSKVNAGGYVLALPHLDARVHTVFYAGDHHGNALETTCGKILEVEDYTLDYHDQPTCDCCFGAFRKG